MEDQLLILHTNLKADGYDLPDYETFKSELSNPETSLTFHENLIKDGYELPDYDTFLSEVGLKKKEVSEIGGVSANVSAQVSLTEQPQLEPTKEEEHRPILDALRSLKSGSLKALGGITGAPSFLNRTFTGIAVRPIVKAMGGTDEEANMALDAIAMANPASQGVVRGAEMQQSLIKKANKVDEKIREIEGSIWDNIKKGEWGNAGELVMRGFMSSVPYFAMTAATAGGGSVATLSTIGATASAQQYGELEGVPEPKRRLNAWLYGGFEAAGELVTAGLLRGVGKAFREGTQKTINESFIKGASKQLAKDFGLEGSSEAITQIGQNLTDILTGVDDNKNVLSGVLDAFLIGGITGGGIATAHAIAMLTGRTLASDKEVSDVQENLKQQEVLINQLDQTDVDPVKEALKRNIKFLKVQADLIMDENYELATKLTPEQQNQVAELYSVWNQLQDKIDGGQMTEVEAKAMQKTVEGIKGEIKAIKDDLIKRLDEEKKAEKQAKVDEVKEEQKTELDKLKEEETKKLDKVKDVAEGETVNKKKLEEIKDTYDTKAEEIKAKTEEEVAKIEEEYTEKEPTMEEAIAEEPPKVEKQSEIIPSEEERKTFINKVINGLREFSIGMSENPTQYGSNFTDRIMFLMDKYGLSRDLAGRIEIIEGKGIENEDILNLSRNYEKELNSLLQKPTPAKVEEVPTEVKEEVKIEEPAKVKEPNLFNKQQVIESLLSEYPEEIREQVRNSFARAENFDEIATQAGFNSLGGGQYTRESVAKIQEVEPISKSVEPLSTQENIPAPPKVEEVAEVKEKGEGKYRKTQINALIQDETLQQQEIAKIVDANKEKYTVLHQADAVEQAKDFIDKQGVENATAELKEPTRKMADFPMRQVARQVLLDFYSRAIIDPNAKESDKKKAFRAIDDLQSITAREATKAGQGNALLQIWKSMQPSGLLEYVARKISQSNQKTLDKKIGDSTLGEQLDALYETLNEESKKIILDILAGKPVSMPKQEERPIKEAPKRKTVPKERIKKEQEYRKNLLEQYRKSEKPMAMAVTGLTSSQIELGGNLVASYVREGYYRMQDIVDRLIKDLKSVDIDADEKSINDIFKQPKTDKETLGEYIDKVESKARTRSAEKNISKRISDVITEHWSVKDELKRTLAQKLVDEAGLTEEEANRLEKEILDKFDKEIISRSEKQLTKLLGTTKLPQEKKAKNIVGKMVELINMGALDEDLYRDLFADKFNLVKLTDLHKEEILKLANNVQLASGKGWLERDATIRLAKYIFELYPESRSGEVFDTWISMAYANMLAGPTTSILNIWSAGWNMSTKPIRDLSNLSKWLRLVKDATKGQGDIYNPFGEMFYSPMLRGSQAGLEQAQEVYRNGDLNNKYVEDVAKKNQFKVTQLERDKYGKSKRFKPVNVKIGNKTIDLNLFNAYKYSGRNLSAQDKFMLTTSYEVELAHILRDKLKNKDLKGKALTHEVMSILRGDHIDMEELNANIESEALLYHQMTGEWMTDLQKKIRKREMMLDQLPLTPEEKEEAERLARSNIFTDDRFGVIATMANAIGAAANKSYTAGLIIKPFIPFTKVVGNVAEYMLDHVPFYGFMRANGKSISYIKKLIDSEAQTAQMGERGSRAYYEQMGRAWLGTMSFVVMGMLFLGRDDEDFMEVSGGYLQEGFKKKGRENVLPPYTLRIGNIKIPYKNIPALAIPLALIGNVNDALKSKQDEGDVMDRFTVALFLEACQNTVFMFKDMSFLDGAQRLAQIASDIASTDEKKWKDISENAIKSYLGFATRPLPQNNNAVQQIWKFFDPESYPQSDIKGTLMYAAGVQHFSKYTAIDQLGDVVTSYPGETLMPYTHWFKIKGEDERWKFLAKYNAIPNKIYNRVMQIDTPSGVEKRKLEEDELYEYSKRAGNLFSQKIVKYMSDRDKVAKRGSEIVEREKSNGEIEKINGIREDVEKLWADAKKQSETELFKWSLFKEKFPEKWQVLKDNEALQMPQNSIRDIFIGEEAEKLKFNEEDIAKFNSRAMELYSDMVIPTIKAMDSESRKRKLPTGEKEYDYIINSLWTASKQQAKAEIVEEKMATKK